MAKTQRDWLEAGMQILVERGAPGLSIDALCNRLGVTKGSFYHHFAGQKDYKDALLAFWQQEDTQGVIAAMDAIQNSPSPLDRLIQVLAGRPAESAASELAIRAWALQDPSLRDPIRQVDAQRVDLMAGMLADSSHDEARARQLSRMLYAMLVGSYTIIPPIEKDAVLDLYREFTRLIEA